MSPVTVRLSEDALHLEAFLAPDAPLLPLDALVALIKEQSARLGVYLPLTPRDLEARLRSSRRGAWMTLLTGTLPTPPVDGRVELLVPVPVRQGTAGERGARFAVRAGTPLARLRRGTPGRPGHDLLGRPVPARLPRPGRLPQGTHTRTSDDGTLLLAACDGEVVLQRLLIHVRPTHVHEGDLGVAHGPLIAPGAVFVIGNVLPGAEVRAGGDVYVQGDVSEARVISGKGGNIAITGSVSGAEGRVSELRADGEISCGTAIHAALRAGSHIRLQSEARHSTLRTGGNIYLSRSIERGLYNVQLEVAGALIPALDAPQPFVSMPSDRQHVRVSTRLRAALALHGASSLLFQPCTVIDLSAGGARCRLSSPWASGGQEMGAIVQLKLALSDGEDEVLAIARVSRVIAPTVIAVTFLQMTQRDHDRLTAYCLQLLPSGPHGKLPTAADRA